VPLAPKTIALIRPSIWIGSGITSTSIAMTKPGDSIWGPSVMKWIAGSARPPSLRS
jgi:hypothetical protein